MIFFQNHKDDQQLIKRLIEGEQHAFEQIASEYHIYPNNLEIDDSAREEAIIF